jgi:heme-degrading monooxygenase HmoA
MQLAGTSPEEKKMAIKRVWHGWTTPENADAYWTVLSTVVIPGIEAKGIEGYRGIQVLRRDHGDEVEFVTLMTFDSLESVIGFQAGDYERSYVPEPARKVLKRWDLKATHFEVLDERAEPTIGG